MILNLTHFFDTPIKTTPGNVPGGRIVHGRAMSGSPNISDIGETAIDKQIEAKPKEVKPKVETKRVLTPAQIDRQYEKAMKTRGWMGTAMVAEFAGVTKEAAAHHLRRLLLRDKVERVRELGVKANKHHVKYLWRWKE